MGQADVPIRHSESKRVRDLLADHLELMKEFVEHRRGDTSEEATASGDRRIMRSALVIHWEDADGSDYVTVAGDADLTDLGIKGMLHDGLYAIAHHGEPGFPDSVG